MSAMRFTNDGVMLRPTRRDEVVRRRAAEMALPEVKAWMGSTEGESDASIVETLMNVIGCGDGFTIAKALDDKGWNADAELVELMDRGFVRDAESELIKQWVQCVGVKPKHAIGETVTMLCGFQGANRGVIVDVREDEATYGIHTASQTEKQRWVIAYEDVEPVEVGVEVSSR